jgi:hypothetical protein
VKLYKITLEPNTGLQQSVLFLFFRQCEGAKDDYQNEKLFGTGMTIGFSAKIYY